MTEDILKYAHYFSTGMRVEVELPLPEGKVFRDDANIVFFYQDLLELRLSRNILPEAAILEIGAVLYLRTGKKGSGYRCRAILLRCDSLSRLLMRLTGEILSFNEREFFRIDVFIPLMYRLYSDNDGETMGEERPKSLSGGVQGDEKPAEIDTALEKPLPVAANLSGAGVRINIPDRFEIDELLDLTLYLPSSDERTMTLAGQVVHVMQLGRPGDPHPLYSTALRFVSIGEPDRETLLKFIQKVQLEQLRRLREQSLNYSQRMDEMGEEPFFSRKRVLRVLYTISVALIFVCLILALANYRKNRDKGEIEKTFEDQIRKFIERR
jgi:hypothetical protein